MSRALLAPLPTEAPAATPEQLAALQAILARPELQVAERRSLLDGLSELTQIPYAAGLDPLLSVVGGAQGFIRATLQNTANVTMLEGGYKHNVRPQTASVAVDCRFLPGHEESLLYHP